MKKPFLLLAGANYYPSAGTGDWFGTFESYEEALDHYHTINIPNIYTANGEYDWYKIVDLRDWTD